MLPLHELARRHLDRAQRALADADRDTAIMWMSLAAEVAVSALAAHRGLDTRKNHLRRATVAIRLYELGDLDEDLRALLIRLNEERKAVHYHGRTPDLRGRDWDQVMQQLTGLVAAAQSAASEVPPES